MLGVPEYHHDDAETEINAGRERDTRTTTPVLELLATLQLSDSAFPRGSYWMPHGLEAFSQAHAVDQGSLEELLCGLLLHSVGPGDATALARAHQSVLGGDWTNVRLADQMLFATKLNAELRRASVRSGHQLTEFALSTFGGPELKEWQRAITSKETPGCQPVATAVAYAASGVSIEHAVASDLFAFSTSFLGAALRLGLTEHRHLQVVLHAVAPAIAQATTEALGRNLAEMGGFAPMADVMSADHERAPARLFPS